MGLVGLLGWILARALASLSQGMGQRTETSHITCLSLISLDSNTSNATVAEDWKCHCGTLLEEPNETSSRRAALQEVEPCCALSKL